MARPVLRKPIVRAERWDFGVDGYLLQDEDLHDQVVRQIASLSAEVRQAVRLMAAAPPSERLRIVDEADEAANEAQAELPLARAQ